MIWGLLPDIAILLLATAGFTIYLGRGDFVEASWLAVLMIAHARLICWGWYANDYK